MILQALVDYYDRSDELAPPGWERKRIPYLIEIDADGRFVQLTSLRSGPRPADVPAQLVPASEVRSGTRAYEKPNLLWDHGGFVLGYAKSSDDKDQRNARMQLEHFQARVLALGQRWPESAAIQAVVRFYETQQPQRVLADPRWAECAAIAGCNLSFRLATHADLVVHDASVRAEIDALASAADPEHLHGVCLVTGDIEEIERLHPPIAGVGPKPAPLAAINDLSLPALSSFHKRQGENFPVGHSAAFRYATALNHLLRPDSPQKLRVGSDMAVFWAQRQDPLEDDLAAILGNTDNPNAHAQQVALLYQSIRDGAFQGPRGEQRFFVLGLAPNAGRIAVRFWHASPLGQVAGRIAAWFNDLQMVRSQQDPPYPSLFRLLSAVAQQGKAENIPPRLGGDLMRSVLEGTPYPLSWLQAAVQRCRAEQQVTYLRAASIKACLKRLGSRTSVDNHPTREIQPMLDTANPSQAYRLGRLFAVLEKIQEEANPGLNATIRERYYGAASSTPVAVFTTLMRLKNHHLAKLVHPGRVRFFEQLLGDILGGVQDFPAHLNLPDQGRFAIGYYHQRQDLFTKKESAPTDTATAGAAAA